MYSIAVRPALDRTLARMAKKNRQRYEAVLRKVEEIVQNPHRYKNLRAPLQHWKRVHVEKHFVLTFSIDEEKKVVILEDFEHHDKAYKR